MSPIAEAVRSMPAAPSRWRRSRGGVWYYPVGNRLVMIFSTGTGGYWWRLAGIGGRCCRSLRRAMLEGQRAALIWVLRGGWAVKAKRRPKFKGRFVPSKADRAAVDKAATELRAGVAKSVEQLRQSIEEGLKVDHLPVRAVTFDPDEAWPRP
jgi:hypothetical protein